MTSFGFQLIIPHGSVYEGEVAEVNVPTPNGEISVLADHMPLATAVQTGVLAIRETVGSSPDHYAIEDGMMLVDDQGVVVTAAAAIHADRIDELEAQKRLVEARAALSSILTDEEVAQTEGIIERQLAHIEAFERHKSYHARH